MNKLNLLKLNKMQEKYLPSSISFLYMDTGNGYSLNEVLSVPMVMHERFFEATINLPPDVKNIRFEPVKGYACILYNVHIVTDAGEIEYAPINGIKAENVNVFDNLDPQIIIDFKGKAVSCLRITGNIRHFLIDDISFLSRIKQVFKNYVDAKSKIEVLVTERDALAVERDRLANDRDRLINSRSWRFTKPLRNATELVRRHKALRLFAKSLLSIKRNGVLGTLKKIVNYLDSKKANNVFTVEPVDLRTECESNLHIERDSTLITPISLPKLAAQHIESVDVIICVHNALEDVKRCIESVFEYTSEPFNIILVDDGSGQPTKEYLESLAHDCPNIELIRNEKACGYTYAANMGLRHSKAEYCVLLNSDTIVTGGWLDKMIQCKKSDDKIGIVGPLSNTASWQSVPEISGKNGDWAHNNLPDGMNLERFGQLVEVYSGQIYPQLALLNGFCIMLHRDVINQLGYLDEENFGEGFGEEDDYNLRAGKIGIRLAVADDTFIFHAQSKSFTDERRLALCKQNGEKLRKKHGESLVDCCVHEAKDNFIMEGIRGRVQILGEREKYLKEAKERWEGKRILFILLAKDILGGVNVIVQELSVMMTMGIDVCVYNLSDNKDIFEANYSITFPVIYGNSFSDFQEIVGNFDAVCATLFTTVEYCNSEKLSGNFHSIYYIQDYEPYFFEKGSLFYRQALSSYTLIPNMKLVTKSEWNRNIVEKETGAKPVVIGKSVDIDLFRPRKMFPNKDRIVISAMVRPETSRRAPELTLEILNEIAALYGDKVSINVFGSDPNQSAIDRDFWNSNYKNPQIKNIGKLNKHSIASLLSKTDIFADFSIFQAMGLTVMEAMACGCCVIAPRNGGCAEYINENKNGFLVDTADKNACILAVRRLIDDYELLREVSYRAIRDVCAFYPEKCVYNFLEACFEQGAA